jgi:hypothetical protein
MVALGLHGTGEGRHCGMAQTLGWSGMVDGERQRMAASGLGCPACWINFNPRRWVELGRVGLIVSKIQNILYLTNLFGFNSNLNFK